MNEVGALELCAGRTVMPLHSSSTKYPREFTFDPRAVRNPGGLGFSGAKGLLLHNKLP